MHPLKFRLRGTDYSRYVLNGFLSAYFTNPNIHTPNAEAERDLWKDWYVMYIPYMRGLAYFLKIDDMLAKAARDKHVDTRRPLDIIISELAVRRLQGQILQAQDWLDLLYPYLGKERVDKDFEDMSSGKKVVDLSETEIFGRVGKLVEVRQEIMDFGFERSSLDSRIITGLKKGSRAEFAGLQEGDKIVWNSRAWYSNFENNMKLIVERDGKKICVEYWPRSFKLAPSWQLVSES